MATTISQLTQASASEITSDAQLIWQTKDGNTRRVPWSDVNTTLGGARYTATLDVSSAEILAMNTTPLELVAAPGSGKVIKIQSIVCNYTYVSATYATNVKLQVITDGATIAQYEQGMLGATVSTIRQLSEVNSSSTTATQLLDNAAVNLRVETGDPTAGDGTLKIYATYDIVTL